MGALALLAIQCPGFRSSAPAAQSLDRDPSQKQNNEKVVRLFLGCRDDVPAGFGLTTRRMSNAVTVIVTL
jgi:hypothetical protein